MEIIGGIAVLIVIVAAIWRFVYLFTPEGGDEFDNLTKLM